MPKTSNPLVKSSGGQATNIILTVIVLVVAVVVIGGVLLFSGKGQSGGGVDPAVLRKPDSHVLSQAPDNKVTLVEFYDLQCPACYQYYTAVTKQIEQQYQGRITFVTRNFPLDAHPLAMQAAKTVEAAGLQGKYREMYHMTYDNWESWAPAPDGTPSHDQQRATTQLDSFAQKLGLDLNRLHKDMNSPQVTGFIERDKADGNAANVQSTPSFFINGKQFQPKGAKTVEDLVNAFRGELDKELNK